MNSALLPLVTGSGALLATAAKTKSSSDGSIIYIVIIVLFGVYFFWLRPQRNRMRQQQAQSQAAEVGDEVMTTSGIIGRVVSIEGDRAQVETHPGHVMTIHRSALGRRIDPVVPNLEDDEDPEHEHDDAPQGSWSEDEIDDQSGGQHDDGHDDQNGDGQN